MKKLRNYGKNLGRFLHATKLPSGMKIGAGTVRRTRKSKIKQMKTPKETY
jgi:hypothetical protein